MCACALWKLRESDSKIYSFFNIVLFFSFIQSVSVFEETEVSLKAKLSSIIVNVCNKIEDIALNWQCQCKGFMNLEITAFCFHLPEVYFY